MLPTVFWPERVIILFILLLVFGPARVAGIGATPGRTVREVGRVPKGRPDDAGGAP